MTLGTRLIKIPLVLLLLCVMVSVRPLHAAETIIIVRGQDFPPYHYRNDAGIQTGYIIDVIRAVGARLDVTVTFHQHSWSKCLEMVKKGRADAMMNLFKTPERDTFMWFANNILGYEVNRFYKRRTTGLTYTGKFQDLFPLKMGVIRNYSYGKRFDRTHFPHKVELETERELLNALVNNRCDIVLANDVVFNAFIRQSKLESRIVSLSPEVSNEPLYLGFSKALGHQGLAESFSTTLEDLKQSGEYNRILKQYGF